jgi:hypothetical protein
LISYITDNKRDADAGPYLAPAEALPQSETQGLGMLDLQGECFGNLPPMPKDYVSRATLETDLRNVLTDDRHPVITLVGRGGIGKTWLALSVLHRVSTEQRFAAILWFTARDIDLLPPGPKVVRPHVLTERDIAEEFSRLMQPREAGERTFKPDRYLAENLAQSPVGSMLFVFDNFETVRSPADLFAWLDTYIRLPNKILITSRSRDFKGDYPVEVSGMSEQESEDLINSTADELGIRGPLTADYRRDLYHESDGHPYVMKVLLGEVAKAGRLTRVERIIASRDEILDALFERTFSTLSPVAKRVFLTLCNWRSTVPQLAVEAVLLRPTNEKMDIENAIEELHRSSFVEVTVSAQDSTVFLNVPLTAAVFGKRKLAVSPWKNAIEADTLLLREFGAAQESDIRHGAFPRIERMFRQVAARITGKGGLEEYLPILEFVARRYPRAWLLLASLHEESGLPNGLEQAKEAVRRFLEMTVGNADQRQAWERLTRLCERTGDRSGELHALVEMCEISDIPFEAISTAANRVNKVFRDRYFDLDLDTGEQQVVFRRLVKVMEQRIDEGDATDCSRLAWLCLHLHDEERARAYVDRGLAKDSLDDHCLRLAERLRGAGRFGTLPV